MKKVLSLILVFSLVFSLFSTPFSAAELSEEKTVTSISPTEDNIVFIENYDGYYSETDGVFYYDFYRKYKNDLEFTVTYSDGTSENLTIYDSEQRDGADCIECNASDSQREQPWSLGSENYMLVRYKNASVTVQVTIEKNPVESISVASGDAYVYENIDGHISNYLDSDGNEFFYYDAKTALKDVVLGVNYSDGSYGEIDVAEYRGKGLSFRAAQEDDHWTKDKVNYVTVSFYGKEIAVPVTVIESPVEKIELVSGSITLYENADGYTDIDNNGEEYYYYNLPDDRYDLKFRITYKDGTTETGRIYDTVRDRQISSDYSVIQQTEHWAVGKENSFTVSYIGATVKVSVEITETPVESLELISDGYTLYENTNGYWRNGGYFYYYLQNSDEDKIQVKINYKDGTSKIANLTETVDGRTIYKADDQEENPWTVGNTYYVTASVFGASVKIPVKIVENNISSIELVSGTASVTENVGGRMSTDDFGKQYYNYYIWDLGLNNFIFRVNYNDGTFSDIRYGDSNRFSYVDRQNENHWTVGGRNILTVRYLGASYDISVTVNETLVSGISANLSEPIEIAENTNGHYENGRFIYDLPYNQLEDVYFTVDYKTGYNNQLKFTDISSYITYSSDQKTNTWNGGEVHYFTIDYMGAKCDIPVFIKSSNIKSFELISEPLFCYGPNCEIFDIIMDAEFRIHFKDGSTQDISYFDECEGNQIEYVDDRLENPWVVGENLLTLTFAGLSITVPVTVYENPIERMEIVSGPIVLVENLRGSWLPVINNQTGEIEEYFNYDLSHCRNDIKIKLYYKDGTEKTVSANEPPIQGTVFSIVDYQHSEHFKLGTDNYCEIKYLDLPEVRVPVTVVQNPIKKIELVSDGLSFIENTNGYIDVDNEGNEYYRYNFNLYGLKFKVIYRDGHTETVNYEDGIDGNDFTYPWNEQASSPWKKDKENFITLSCMGVSVKVPVTIKEFPIESLELISGELSLIENGNGEFDEKGNFIYRYYLDDADNFKFKVTYKDGHTKTVGIYDTVEGLRLETSDTQREEPWLRGKENYLIVSIGDVKTKVPVKIVESPVSFLELLSEKPEVTGSYNFNYLYQLLDGLVFRIKYKDGSSKIAVYGRQLIDGYSIEVAETCENWIVGENKIKVSYLGAICEVPVTVTSKVVTGLECVSGKFEFYENCGGYIDWDDKYSYDKWANCDVVIRISYSDGSSEVVPFADSKASVSLENQSYQNWTVGGVYDGIVSYGSHSIVVPVVISENTVDRIEITKAPTFVYTYGDSKYGSVYDGRYEMSGFNLEGLEFTAFYKDSSSKHYTYQDIADGKLDFDVEASLETTAKIGKNTVTLSYRGATAEYEAEVRASSVKSVSVIKKPGNTTYLGTPDLTGAVIRITYTDGTHIDKTVTFDDLVPYSGGSSQYKIKLGEDDFIHLSSYTYGSWEISYFDAVCELDFFTPVSEDKVYNNKGCELVNPSKTGDGMSLKITYNDGTGDTVKFIVVKGTEDKDGVFNGIARTNFGILAYSISKISVDGDSTLYIFNSNYNMSSTKLEEKSDVLFGDVNGDGVVNAKDRLHLARWIAKWSEYLEMGINEANADLNGDGKVNAQDRLILARHLAHWAGYETLSAK